MTWEGGFLLGIGIAIVLYVAVQYMERDYYKRKHEIIKEKRERLKKRGKEPDKKKQNDSS